MALNNITTGEPMVLDAVWRDLVRIGAFARDAEDGDRDDRIEAVRYIEEALMYIKSRLGVADTCPQCDGQLTNNHCTPCERRGQ